MSVSALLMAVIMLLLANAPEPENPWKAKIADAVERAEQRRDLATIRDALDAAWRADDWRTGLKLIELARETLSPKDDLPQLRGRLVRALWRAGGMEAAEKLADQISGDTDDTVALRALISIHLARGEADLAQRRAEQLAACDSKTAEDLYHLFAVRFARREYAGLPELLRKAERLINPRNGYPETFLAESIDGLAEFFAEVGTEPLNRIERHGAATMTPLVMLGLPSCDVTINGHGPYKMVLDTGGSIMLSLDQEVADEIGLKSIAPASVRGVSGQQETGQAIVDSLQMGNIGCRRVITRTFPVRAAVMNAADGIIGTGIFANGRLTMDFDNGQIVVAPSSPTAAAGRPVALRLVGDAKLMTIVQLEGQPCVALLDSGADAVAVSPSRLKELLPDKEFITVNPGIGLGIGGDDTPEISFGAGVDVELGGRTFENYSGLGLDVLDTLLSPILGVRTDILIGMPTFRQTRSITIDFPTCRMWIDWLEE